jgi:DNA-binding NarL/FixJ family response regulator
MTGRRILIVDDHAGFRTTARRWLEAEGWTVVGEAHDGASALAAAEALHPDVVLLDIGLPDIDGFTVAESFSPDDPPTVVLISSRDPDGYAEKVAASLAIGFIAKHELDGDGLRAMLSASRP